MKQIIFKRLFDSFSELETAVSSARKTLEKKGHVPNDMLGRIDVYEEILQKQRTLAFSLAAFVAEENWNEVNRHIQLINGLSSMIRDDAREVLAGFRTPVSLEDRESLYS